MGNELSQNYVPNDSEIQNVEKVTKRLMSTKSWQPDITDLWLQFTKKFKPHDFEINSTLLSSLYRENGTIDEPSVLTDAINKCKCGKGSSKDNDIVIFAWMLTKNMDYFRSLEANALTELAKSIKVGNGMDPDTQMGPLNNKNQLERIEELVEDAKAHGAKIEAGGGRLTDQDGYFYQPTIVTGIKEYCISSFDLIRISKTRVYASLFVNCPQTVRHVWDTESSKANTFCISTG